MNTRGAKVCILQSSVATAWGQEQTSGDAAAAATAWAQGNTRFPC